MSGWRVWRVWRGALPGVLVAMAVALGHGAAAAAGPLPAADAARYPAVRPGGRVDPRLDRASHPAFRTEWWYVTGWLADEAQRPIGFQLTFFRSRPAVDDADPSAFAAHQILIAHAALIPGDGSPPWHAQRISRAGFGLAEAEREALRVYIDDWRLEESPGGALRARAGEAQQGFALDLEAGGPPLVNGEQGYSQKGPAPDQASYYYSVPQLRVHGRVRLHGVERAVSGTAWLDHEWSSRYLDADARGWDWVGLNLGGGGALMAFRIRDAAGRSRYAGASYRDPGGAEHHYGPAQVSFRPGRTWRSPRTGTSYPVEWLLRVGELEVALEPLVDDQEADTRLTTGAVYWEGAVTARGAAQLTGRGFLELTGYGEALRLP